MTVRPEVLTGRPAGAQTAPAAFGWMRVPALGCANTRVNLHGHLPVLDGVRGLAVVMVMTLHFVSNVPATNRFESVVAGVTSYGSYGVELFFILSGFLITGILYDTRDHPHHFRNFYMRRLLRIFPLYYGVLVLVFFVAPMVPALRGPSLTYMTDRQAWAWLYAVNIYIAERGEWCFYYINHFWSLSIEEHFYLFWPFLVFALARRPRDLVALSLAIALSAMLARLVGSLMGLSWWTTYTLTPFRLDGLAVGAFLALTIRQPGGLGRAIRPLPGVVTIVMLLLALTYVWTRLVSRQGLEMVLPVRAALITTLLACLVLWVLVAPERSATSRFFRSRRMVFLGKYSYGLYVYHHFLSFYFDVHRTDLTLAGWIGSHSVAVGVQATLGAMASLLLAYLSYELYEKHFLRLKQGFTADDRPCAAHRPGSLAPVVEECSPGTDADWAAAPSANGEPRPPKG